MRADISESRGSKQRIAKRMGQNIAIGMADRTFIERQLNYAYDQLPPRLDPMQVVSDAAAHAHFFCRPCSR
jgi:hypothetical protein